jgi:hypothetical protein
MTSDDNDPNKVVNLAHHRLLKKPLVEMVSGDHRDLLNRLTHVLLLALPRCIEIDADTSIKVIRANDPDQLPDGDDPAEVPSPLFVDNEDMKPMILVGFERKGKFDALFGLKQIGRVLVQEGATPDDLLPAVADPCENPQ